MIRYQQIQDPAKGKEINTFPSDSLFERPMFALLALERSVGRVTMLLVSLTWDDLGEIR